MMTNMTMTSSTISNYTDNLPDFVYKFTVEDHDYWKPIVLNSIERAKEINNIKLNEKGYYYDFNIPNAPRPYVEIINNIILDFVEDIRHKHGFKRSELRSQKWWFQQYIQGSDFGWHEHAGHWAFVYYVELPEMNEATEFLNFLNGDFNLKEGDVIFFPTFLIHRSPEIKSNLRKTIVAGNIQFSVDREMIEKYGKEYFRN